MSRHKLTRSMSRRGRQQAEDRRGYIVIGICAVLMVVVGVSAFTMMRQDIIDPKTGCPKGHQVPIASTVILVDETDSLSRSELAFAKTLIMNEYTWLPRGGQLTVRNIVADPDQAEDIVVCRMDDGAHELGLVRNARKVKQDFQRIAGARLDELFTALRTAAPQKYSPILESITAVFDKPNFVSVKQRRLVVLSDMAQHSPLFSQYRRHGAGPRADQAGEYRRDMSGTAIRIQYIRRPELARVQTDAHRQFWTGYLRGMGAGDVQLGHAILLGEDPNREVWNDES